MHAQVGSGPTSGVRHELNDCLGYTHATTREGDVVVRTRRFIVLPQDAEGVIVINERPIPKPDQNFTVRCPIAAWPWIRVVAFVFVVAAVPLGILAVNVVPATRR